MNRSGIFIVFFIFIAISILVDWYVFSGLKTITNTWQKDTLRLIVNWGYFVLSLGIIAIFLFALSGFNASKGVSNFQSWILSLFLGLLITKIVIILILFLGDIGQFIYNLINKLRAGNESPSNPILSGRRKFISEIAFMVGAIPLAGTIYAMLKGKYDYRVHRQTIYYDDLPADFDGFTITQLSDIHSGSFDNTEAMQRGIDFAKNQKSDLFVFTGDLVNNFAWEIEPYINRFSQIKAPFGQFSVLGNHDYGDYAEWSNESEKADNLEKLKQHHKSLDYRLLLDENITLEKNGQKISLIGVQNWGKGFKQVGNLDKALNGVDDEAFKILLSHDPTHWEEKVKTHPVKVHLTLSGHTHGAQFGIEIPGLKWSPVKYRYPDWAGLAHENGRYLYINRGFGFLGFSGRLGIWPEITVITLKKA
jgi:predicted MPP superfamily phosphohydrolase